MSEYLLTPYKRCHINLLICMLVLFYVQLKAQSILNTNHPFNLDLIPAVQNVHLTDSIAIRVKHFKIQNQQLFKNEVQYLSSSIKELEASTIHSDDFQRTIKEDNKKDEMPIHFFLNDSMALGAYSLEITSKQITLQASQPRDIFYACITLLQILSLNKNGIVYNLPPIQILDHAQFEWRGLLLDCCRHFFSVRTIKKHIDALAFYKMNVLHWHLTEDQGWRIEIDAFPFLTEVGSWRTEKDGTKYGGYYSKEEIKEIIEYARSRHIRVIPEIEMPGHALAALASYPELGCRNDSFKVGNKWGVFKDVYCAGSEYTFTFLEKVLDEVIELFPEKYIHIGGDECPKVNWGKCSKCQARIKNENLKGEAELQAYFIQRIASYLAKKGKQIIGWDEILEGGIAKNAIVQSWRGMKGAKEAIHMHHEVISSPTSHCYLDYSLKSIDLEKIYSFDPIPKGIAPSDQYLVKGAEGNMWTEWVTNDSILDDRIYPRIIGLSEVLWQYDSTRNYSHFQRRLQSHYPILKRFGIQAGAEGLPIQIQTNVSNGHLNISLFKTQSDIEITFRSVDSIAHSEKQYIVPLNINEDQTLQFQAYRNNRTYGSPIIKKYSVHQGLGRSIQLDFTYSPFYPSSGNNAIIDGNLGSTDYRDGHWQGVQGDDISAVIDLGEPQTIHSLQSHFLHKQDSWIFIPSKVIYSISVDGKHFKPLDPISSNLSLETDEISIERFQSNLTYETTARFIKIHAFNQGECPSWHDAAGSKTWLFIDELIIK